MRLDSFLAKRGVSSRRKAKDIIQKGRVTVDGSTVTTPGFSLDNEKNKVLLDGKEIEENQQKYILMNKPRGYLTTLDDPQGRPTVKSLLPPMKERLFPVGRLDLDTEGLLLLTNDGDLAFRLTHPKFEKEKEYLALVKGNVTKEKIKLLEKGIELEDGKTSPAKIKNKKYLPDKNNTRISLVIHEGKKRQVKRMFKEIGCPVISLKRTRLSFLTTKELKPGQVRHLTRQEVKRLQRETGL